MVLKSEWSEAFVSHTECKITAIFPKASHIFASLFAFDAERILSAQLVIFNSAEEVKYAKNPEGHTIPSIWIKELWTFLLNSFMNFWLGSFPRRTKQATVLMTFKITQSHSQQKNCQNNSTLKQKQTKSEVFSKNSSNHICVFSNFVFLEVSDCDSYSTNQKFSDWQKSLLNRQISFLRIVP